MLLPGPNGWIKMEWNHPAHEWQMIQDGKVIASLSGEAAAVPEAKSQWYSNILAPIREAHDPQTP